MMLTRILLLSFLGISLFIFVKLFSIGHNFRTDGPLKNGFRKRIIQKMYRVISSNYIWVNGISSSVKTHDQVKYTKYSGPKYAENEYASTIVSNHTTWLDPMVLIKEILPAFSPTAGVKDVPFITTLCDGLDSIYIPRGGSDKNKADALIEIKNR